MRKGFKLLRFIFVFILAVLLLVNLPITVGKHTQSTEDYSSWMNDSLSGEERIIDVAMLGAHDAFTNEIQLFSKIDKESASGIQTGVTGALIKGFSVRESKTQVSDILTLLKAGVRYFDIRLTYDVNQDKWMTSHTYISSDFSEILTDMNLFLSEHPGEVLLLDIQHVYGVSYTDSQAFDSLVEIFEETSILEYAYQENDTPLNEITINQITSNQSKAGVMIFSKFEETHQAFWSYGSSIRSAWPNSDNPEHVYDFLSEEQELILSHQANTGNQMNDVIDAQDSLLGFRIMQGVLTMQMNPSGIIKALTSWSLLERAKHFNTELINHEDFPGWMSAMPIIMVDFSDSNTDSFLDDMMQKIIDFNQMNE